MKATVQQLANLKKGWDRDLQLKNLSKGWEIGWKKNRWRNGIRIYSDERLLEILVELQTKLNRVPTKKDITHPSITTYKKRFGTWNKALLSAGITNLYGYDFKEKEKNSRRISLRMRFKILKRDNFRCQYCGKTPQDGIILHIDHKTPPNKGGKTIEENLITSCHLCNIGKSNIY